MRGVHQYYPWNIIEGENEDFGTVLYNSLDDVNSFFSAYGIKIELNIPILNTHHKLVPQSLDDIAFDDPVFIERFCNFLNMIFVKLTDVELVSLEIGNEHGFYLATNLEIAQQFKSFLEA